MLKMKNAATLVTLLAVLLTCSVAAAEIKLPSVIGSGMVLQQGAYCPIWGWAEPGEKIAVSYDNRSATTVTDDDGIWVVVLKERPIEYGMDGSAIQRRRSGNRGRKISEHPHVADQPHRAGGPET